MMCGPTRTVRQFSCHDNALIKTLSTVNESFFLGLSLSMYCTGRFHFMWCFDFQAYEENHIKSQQPLERICATIPKCLKPMLSGPCPSSCKQRAFKAPPPCLPGSGKVAGGLTWELKQSYGEGVPSPIPFKLFFLFSVISVKLWSHKWNLCKMQRACAFTMMCAHDAIGTVTHDPTFNTIYTCKSDEAVIPLQFQSVHILLKSYTFSYQKCSGLCLFLHHTFLGTGQQ